MQVLGREYQQEGSAVRHVICIFIETESMTLYLLDGVGAGFLLLLFALGIAFLLIAILLEAFIMQWMKFELIFQKALIRSLAVNLISLAAGFLLTSIDAEFFELSNPAGFAIFFAVTVLVEFVFLHILYAEKSFSDKLKVSIVMNLCTYLLAFILIWVMR